MNKIRIQNLLLITSAVFIVICTRGLINQKNNFLSENLMNTGLDQNRNLQEQSRRDKVCRFKADV